MNILAIDPSVNFCGAAVFNENTKELVYHHLIKSVDISEDGDKFAYTLKSKQIVLQLKMMIINKYDIKKIILEVPEYWKVGGFIARESGSIFKLTFICGMIFNISDDIEYILYSPTMWKKQLPKNVVNNRLQKYYDVKSMNHNVVDAIGIGHFYLHKNIK